MKWIVCALMCILPIVGISAPVQSADRPTVDIIGRQDRRVDQRTNQVHLPSRFGNTISKAPAHDAATVARGWQQQAKLTAGDAHPDNHFGGSLALSEDTALVGAWGTHSDTGTAYVFVRRGSRWTQQAALTESDGAAGDHFGTSVELSGNTALVGAPGKTSYTGAVYVFVRSGSRWSQQARLTANDGAMQDWFGRSVVLSGDSALVSAWSKHGGTGAAYVFVRHGTYWVQQAELTAGNSTAGDHFGTSVALSGDTALVGAGFTNDDTGAAYVFVRHRTQWTQQAMLTAGDRAAGDIFGTLVVLSDGTALVGAGGKTSYTGAAYVFVQRQARWTQQAKLTASDGAVNDWFGRSVMLHGDTALVGAWFKDSGTGAAYVFVRQGTGWTQQAVLSAKDAKSDDNFGSSVALDGATALVGAGFKNSAAGAAYVFVQSGNR